MEKSVSRMSFRERWQEYERRKSLLWRKNLSSTEYDAAILKLAQELGI